jgi:hypothetical protein
MGGAFAGMAGGFGVGQWLIEQHERKLRELRRDLTMTGEGEHIARDIDAKENFLKRLWAELAASAPVTDIPRKSASVHRRNWRSVFAVSPHGMELNSQEVRTSVKQKARAKCW